MLIGVPKEIKNHEYRVGMAPASVREAVTQGHQVMIRLRQVKGLARQTTSIVRSGLRLSKTPKTSLPALR